MTEEKQEQQIEPKEEQKAEAVAQTAAVSQPEEEVKAEAQPETKPAKKTTKKTEAKTEKSPRAKATKKTAAPPAREKRKRESFGDLLVYPGVRTDLPPLKSGDVIKVAYRVIEGGKERTQLFEGTIIALKNRGISKTVTVRKTSFGVSVERILPLNSKLVQSIEVVKHQRVRRAKLYYLRKLSGKAARLKEVR